MEEAFAAVFDSRTGLHTKGTDLLLIRELEIDREYRFGANAFVNAYFR
jgi:hypothetical protein